MLINVQSKRDMRLKHHVDLNTLLTNAKFFNITFLQEFFNLNKEIYRILYFKCKK